MEEKVKEKISEKMKLLCIIENIKKFIVIDLVIFLEFRTN